MSTQAYYNLLKRPLITEKANDLKEALNQYSFEVAMTANKIEIRKAIESLFKVDVVCVRTSIVRGKNKRVGRRFGRRPNWKKAIITLPKGQEIDFFEGV
jgi:large subunit ribosomal protein L23